MEIIPVIDLKNGVAVHAREGRREQYRPLESPLCASPEPKTVVSGLLGLHAFKTIYIADLDALMGKEPQTGLVDELRRAFPDLTFWIDRGVPDHGKLGLFCPEDRTVSVIGSESLDVERLSSLETPPIPFILSLDFRAGCLLGPEPLLQRPELWPDRVILMSLTHVGGTAGPDFVHAEEFRSRYPQKRFIAAGGVRNEEDLERFEAMGMAAVLIASALHSGVVDARVLGGFG